MLRSLTALLAAAGVALSGVSAHAQDGASCPDELQLGIEAQYPPFQYKDEDGAYKGFDVDIAEAICDEMGMDCAWVEVAWAAMIPALKAKKYDVAVGSMAATDRRDQQVDFTNKYYDGAVQFVGRKDMDVEISKEGLEGLTVGVQRATTQEKLVTNRFAGVMDVRTYDTQKEVNLDLINGRLDLMVADRIVIDWSFLQSEDGQPFAFKGPKFGGPKYYGDGIAFAVREGDDRMRRCMNAGIAAIRENGTYQEISNEHFGRNIYNG